MKKEGSENMYTRRQSEKANGRGCCFQFKFYGGGV